MGELIKGRSVAEVCITTIPEEIRTIKPSLIRSLYESSQFEAHKRICIRWPSQKQFQDRYLRITAAGGGLGFNSGGEAIVGWCHWLDYYMNYFNVKEALT